MCCNVVAVMFVVMLSLTLCCEVVIATLCCDVAIATVCYDVVSVTLHCYVVENNNGKQEVGSVS